MVHPPALVLSAVALLAVLAAAAAGSRRLPPSLVAVLGAALLVLLGAVGPAAAVGAVGDIVPTVAFLVVILLLAHLADREGLFTWAAAATGRRAGRSSEALLARVVGLAAVVTAVLSLDATVLLLTPVVLVTARRMGVPARPHAFAAGHLANSASLLLPVSNLTNLLAFSATGLSFSRFTELMAALAGRRPGRVPAAAPAVPHGSGGAGAHAGHRRPPPADPGPHRRRAGRGRLRRPRPARRLPRVVGAGRGARARLAAAAVR